VKSALIDRHGAADEVGRGVLTFPTCTAAKTADGPAVVCALFDRPEAWDEWARRWRGPLAEESQRRLDQDQPAFAACADPPAPE